MSSPLASLNKTRKVPLQSEPMNPGRRGIRIYGDEDEVDMPNDGPGSEEQISVPSCYSNKFASVSRPGPPYHDSDMARKMQELEQQVKAQSDEMVSKDQKILALEDLVQRLQQNQGEVSGQRQEELQTMCTQLQRQVREMERFLNDYGLQWVGEPMDQEDSEDKTVSEEEERDWMTAKKFWKPGSRMTAEKFLNRLPKVVIRQGQVIDIRGPIRDTLQNYCPLPARIQETIVETPALVAERERSQKSPNTPAPPLSMLRIKSENGEQVFLLMMWPNDTIGDVRALLTQARWAQGRSRGCREAPAQWLGLIHSTGPPGAWMQPPLRSSVPSHSWSTRTTHSHCRMQAWCPTQHCYCGHAGPHCLTLAPTPALAMNKVPGPDTISSTRMFWQGSLEGKAEAREGWC
ncbi:UBX domain-containing protein 11 isoform X12 [Ictidomys tridecemlineatus]|uniref:UBX domain-containing protein 11 isoform X9 n=1 Tax=Ictidomys tridecemlineatus TaxID=43179 RepID=UPI001A9F15F7|nr:UBX domain-containing protein 11 isoform X9 [Ictidomys tridecemlineatus]